MAEKTILFVDDDDNIRTVIAIALEHFGFRVLTAFDAVSTFSILQQNKVDLIIMDNGLPGIDGIDLAAELLRQAPYATLPIVLFTGTRDRELSRRARAAGLVDCWIKPMGLKLIQQKICDILSLADGS